MKWGVFWRRQELRSTVVVSEVAGKCGLICVGIRWERGITPWGLQEKSDCRVATCLAYNTIILVIRKIGPNQIIL